MRSVAAIFLFGALCSSSFAQWADIQHLGKGGESYVSTDGNGNVYATCHQPCKLFVSNDFGKTFAINHDLPDAFCDVTSAIGADGKLYVVYLVPGVKGVQVVSSTDKGRSISKVGKIAGPYDREWLIVNPITNEVAFNYSDGYIGGPKSKGIFYANSTDGAASFKTISRIDKEPEGSYPVDPYLTVGTGGRVYAAWACSFDYDHIDKYMFASSDDGGKTWKNHTLIGSTHPELGDTQERWMLGSIVAIGKDTVMALYQDYAEVEVDGETARPLLAFFRISKDAGKTWTETKPCLSMTEIQNAIRSFKTSGAKSSTVPNYVQTLPWVASDPKGKVHFAFEDNRSGQKNVSDKRVGLWQVRYASWTDGMATFGPSERVSHDWAAERPPLDFIGSCSDGESVWITWTENPNQTSGWGFSGELYIGKKPLGAKQLLLNYVILDATPRQQFADVPQNHWASHAVRTLREIGILHGYPNGKFKG